MKKIILSLMMISMLAISVGFVIAVKPDKNLASAEKVPWHLSAEVMPVPPYGSIDIDGSDTASKLIVNQPNGAVEVTITGAMNGLNPDTTYTVYLSNGYEEYKETGWDVTGNYVIDVKYLGIEYPETLILAQSGTGITGTSLNTIPPADGSAFTIISGSVSEDVVNFVADHVPSSLEVHMQGTIATDGSMSGTWHDKAPGSRAGTWESTSGAATDHTGDTGWSGLFTSTIQPFTFITDEFGAGSWHINLRDDDFPKLGNHELSVWINKGGTMLISDTFNVVVD